MAARRVAAIALISLPVFETSGGRAIGRTARDHRHRQPDRSPRLSRPAPTPGPRDTAPDTPFEAAAPVVTPDPVSGHAADRDRSVCDRHRHAARRDRSRHRSDAWRNPAGKARHHVFGLRARCGVAPDHPRSRQLPRPHPGKRHRLKRRLGTRRRPRGTDRSARAHKPSKSSAGRRRCATARRRSAAWSMRRTTASRPRSRERGLAVEGRGAITTVDRGREGAVLLDAGGGNFAIHADMWGRSSGDYKIPSYPYLFPELPAPFVGPWQPNSAHNSNGNSIGGSYRIRSGLFRLRLYEFREQVSGAGPGGDRDPHQYRHEADQAHQQRRVPPRR